jgi:hypothetical protein
MIRVVHPGSGFFYPSRIPDPGVKKAQDPGSGSATLAWANFLFLDLDSGFGSTPL